MKQSEKEVLQEETVENLNPDEPEENNKVLGQGICIRWGISSKYKWCMKENYGPLELK